MRERMENVHIVVLTKITQISIQLLDTLLMGLTAFTLETLVELLAVISFSTKGYLSLFRYQNRQEGGKRERTKLLFSSSSPHTEFPQPFFPPSAP